jgi:hypothetical protein
MTELPHNTVYTAASSCHHAVMTPTEQALVIVFAAPSLIIFFATTLQPAIGRLVLMILALHKHLHTFCQGGQESEAVHVREGWVGHEQRRLAKGSRQRGRSSRRGNNGEGGPGSADLSNLNHTSSTTQCEQIANNSYLLISVSQHTYLSSPDRKDGLVVNTSHINISALPL